MNDMTRGLIPLDFIENDTIDVKARIQTLDCRGYDNLQPPRPEIPEFLVIHKAQSEDEPGVTLGTPGGYFTARCCPALTDLEVNPSTGRMRRFVQRGTNIAGWANGVISSPYGDALAYINWKAAHGGWNPNYANILGEACEILGYFPSYPVTQDTPVGEAARDRLATWMASRAHDYGIRWQDFPIVVDEGGRSYITWHREWTIGTGKTCPGPLVMSITSELIERARAKMKAVQEPAAPAPEPLPEYAAVEHPVWWAEQLEKSKPTDQSAGGATWYVLQRNFKCLADTPRRAKPNTAAKVSGPSVKAGEKITVERTVYLNDRLWLIEETGHALLAAKFSPKFGKFAPREA